MFAAYRSLVAQIAQRLARYPHGQVAFEMLNEPPRTNCETTGWIREQQILLADVRAIARALPVLVYGCREDNESLLSLNRSNLNMDDPNLVFAFHFIDPYVFTAQGGATAYKYIEGLRYPASAGNIDETLAETNRNIDAAGLSEMDAFAARASAAKIIAKYYAQAPDRSFIEQRLEMVLAWARENGIAPSRLLIGEYDAINWRKTDSPEYLQSRLRWDNDVKAVADSLGIANAFWALPDKRGPIFR
jgi:hypothetical protein